MVDSRVMRLEEIESRVRRLSGRVGPKAANEILCRLLERRKPDCARDLILTALPVTSRHVPVPDLDMKKRLIAIMSQRQYQEDILVFTKCISMMAGTFGTKVAFRSFSERESFFVKNGLFVKNMYIVLISSFREYGDIKLANILVSRLFMYPLKKDLDCPPQVDLPSWLSANGFRQDTVEKAREYVAEWRRVVTKGATG